MPPKIGESQLLNPRQFEHPILVGVGVGVAQTYLENITVSTYLHAVIHGLKLSDRANRLFGTLNFLTTGMALGDWIDHLAHHAFPGRYAEEAHLLWNATRPEGAPESPKEVWRDPYGTELDGYLQVGLNTAGLHRRAKVPSLEFVRALIDYDIEHDMQDRNHWPEHLRYIDISVFDPDALYNKRPWLGMVASGIALAGVFGPLPAGVSSAIEIPSKFAFAGLFINGICHTGQEEGAVNRSMVLAGLKEPVLDEKGERAADLFKRRKKLPIVEIKHWTHHNKPSNPIAAGDRFFGNPSGFIIRLMMLTGDAALPAVPTYQPDKVLGRFSLSWLRNADGPPATKDYPTQLAEYRARRERAAEKRKSRRHVLRAA